ncbi:hypothetical protein FB45DRAFT_1052173 [Roridomyces roridus]|uniref:SET domain-containing protein n=1 Tax=Roridomyces roridus TaxID=1738132 RepID=A0AAD7CG41_9AGAR|nr:hypothetical protein FB45DRAFT_1052173 [Roridomyces roridus]
MKRGFLNSSKAKAQPLGPDLKGTSTKKAPAQSLLNEQVPVYSPQPDANGHYPKFPIGKQPRVDVPEGYSMLTPYTKHDPRAKIQHNPDTMLFTTLPIDAPDDEPVSECFFFHGSKELVVNLPGFPKPLVHPSTPAHRMGSTPGKGMGLFSTRALKTGELILTERPLLVAPRGLPTAYPSSFTHEQYLQHSLNELEKAEAIAVERMRPEDRKAFMALSNCHKEDGSGPVVGIVRTNSLALGGLRPGVTDEMGEYCAVPKDISRLNHSCSPNTATRFDKASFSYSLFAVREIGEGEELTYTYTDTLVSKAERHTDLKPYGFVCSCTACEGPESDARRAYLKKMGAPQIYVWLYNPPELDNMFHDECRRQLALIQQEGLEHGSHHYKILEAAMEGSIAMGDAQGASEWAAKLVKISWHGEPADVKAYLDPASSAFKKHPMWRKRVDRSRDPLQGILELAALANKDGQIRPWSMMFPM